MGQGAPDYAPPRTDGLRENGGVAARGGDHDGFHDVVAHLADVD